MAHESNARIVYTPSSESDWRKYNPTLQEGELVASKQTSGNVKLVMGGPGGTKYSESTVVWDRDEAQDLTTRTETAESKSSASATAAATSESNAKASATAASTSASNASASATAAATSESNASTSATAAASSANDASTSATNASSLATQAGKSASASATSATASATSETNAKAAETAAANSATDAAGSATAAANSAAEAKTTLANVVLRAGDTMTGDLTVPNLKATGNVTVTGNVTAAKVYNAVYADYAEFFPRGGETRNGDIVALDTESDKEVYVRATKWSECAVGVHSEGFAQIIGGHPVKEGEDVLRANIKDYIPVALAGRVYVRFKGTAIKGGYVVPSEKPGVGCLYTTGSKKNVVGVIVQADHYKDERLVKILVRGGL